MNTTTITAINVNDLFANLQQAEQEAATHMNARLAALANGVAIEQKLVGLARQYATDVSTTQSQLQDDLSHLTSQEEVSTDDVQALWQMITDFASKAHETVMTAIQTSYEYASSVEKTLQLSEPEIEARARLLVARWALAEASSGADFPRA